MGSTRFIDALRITRDGPRSFAESSNERVEPLKIYAIKTLEMAEGDDLLCILVAAAMVRKTGLVYVFFRQELETSPERYFDFLCDELESYGFDTNYVMFEDETCCMAIPLFTTQDEEEEFENSVTVHSNRTKAN